LNKNAGHFTIRDLSSQRMGFTLIEVVVVIAVIAIMAAILSPVIAKNIKDAKVSRAMGDVKVLTAAVGDFFKDLKVWPFLIDGAQPVDVNNHLYLLAGYGQDGASSGGTTRDWNRVGGWPADKIDRMENHLIRNHPPVNSYNADLWHGPYIAKITADPWGTHYSINVAYLTSYHPEGEVVWVISAGENKTWETEIAQRNDTIVIGGDDIVFRVK